MTPDSPVDRQREHQANERTFLAWVRTSIALIGFGFAIARFGIFLRQLEWVHPSYVMSRNTQEFSLESFYDAERHHLMI